MDKPTPRRFQPRSAATRLAPDVQARHGRIATEAFLAFGDAAGASAFLNTHHDDLGGRPLDVAGKSADGLAEVSAVLRMRATA